MYSKQCNDFIGPILHVLAVLLVFIFVPSPPASYATFPGTNGEIAFTSIRDGVSEVYVMNSDGSGQTNCTINPTEDINPAWSPDGTKIAFASNRDGNFEIYVVNTNCMTGLVRLTTNLAYNIEPKWSPDGKKIGFISFRDGNNEIYIMNADGTGQTNCTNNSASEDGLEWSPDGTKIAFNSSRGGDDRQIYVMSANCTGTPTKLTNGPGENINPSWSPDGTKILFTSGRDGNAEIYVMHADGSDQTNLTNSPTADGAAIWSPDGTKIAWASGRPSNSGYNIWVMNADGTAPTPLTSSGGDSDPDWGKLVSSVVPFTAFNVQKLEINLHSAPFFAVRKQFWQNFLKRGENEFYQDDCRHSHQLF